MLENRKVYPSDLLFQLLAREVFIVMLRRIELFPVVMKLTFQSGKTKDLLEVLFQTLGLPIQQSGTAELPLERLNQIDHLFTYEAIEWAMVFLTNSPMVAADVYFYEFLSYMLIRKNTLFGKELVNISPSLQLFNIFFICYLCSITANPLENSGHVSSADN